MQIALIHSTTNNIDSVIFFGIYFEHENDMRVFTQKKKKDDTKWTAKTIFEKKAARQFHLHVSRGWKKYNLYSPAPSS